MSDVRQTKEDVKTICKEDVEIFDYENELRSIKDEIIKYKNIFLIIFSVIFIFSGINIMNVCFFSIKERVSEIGVRKAYGASSTMIFSIIPCIYASRIKVVEALRFE